MSWLAPCARPVSFEGESGVGEPVVSAEPPLRPRRVILFLQGNISGFFQALGKAALARGFEVRRINFNGGDAALWRLPGAVDFTGRPAQWPAFFDAFVEAHGVSDVVLCGDCRPLHVEAIRLARARGVAVHVADEGYLRPGWITFERDGVNGHSRLPRTPEGVRDAVARAGPDVAPVVASQLGVRGGYVTLYHQRRLAMAWRFPHYRFHTPNDPALELAGWTRRLFTRGREAKAGLRLMASLPAQAPLFLMPLQLDTDFQVRVHSPFDGMAEAMETVARDFAAHAPADAHLLIKSHPLEGRLVSWRSTVEALTRRHGLQGRLHYLEHRNIYALISRARAVVTVNSTVGALALELGCPVVALGEAVYAMEGLTFQGPLARFWNEPTPPDAALFADFRRMLIDRCLAPGGFFTAEGVRAAVAAALARIEAEPAACPA